MLQNKHVLHSIHTCLPCLSRAILSEQFKGGGGGDSEGMVLGRILHTVFQNILEINTQGPEVTTGMIVTEMKKVMSTLEYLELL